MNTDRSSPGRLAVRRSGVVGESLGLSFRSLMLSLVTMRVLHIFNANPVSGNGNDILEVVSKAAGEILMIHFGIGQCDDTENSSQGIFPSKDEVIRCVVENLSLMGTNQGRFTASDVLASQDNEPSRFIASLRTEGRRLFRTNNGWIGLAPRSSQVGDEAWRFKESNIFYILRPSNAKDGTYNFIGESYIHGVAAGAEPQCHQWTEAVLV
jgi:hypothetical protein